MYEYLVPLGHAQSMKYLNGKFRTGKQASFLCGLDRVNIPCMITDPKDFSFFSKSPHKSRGRYVGSDWYECIDDQNENGMSVELAVANRSRFEQEFRKGARGTSELLHPRSCSKVSHTLWVFFFLSLLFVGGDCQSDNNQTDNQCALGIMTPGRTWPKGDITLERGQSLRIFCILNETLTDPELEGKNASDLVFFRHDTKLETEYVTVINSTTSMMHVENLNQSEDMYYCRLKMNENHSNNHKSVCLNKVIVGSKPEKPLNFTCFSQNWDNLTCTWTPKRNVIETKFSLVFRLAGRAGGRTFFKCPKHEGEQLPPNTCVWTVSTAPIYRQVHENYTFILYAENVLGNNSFLYKWHHWAHVIPSEPVNLTFVNKTHSSVMLNWKIPTRMKDFPPGLHHRIAYQSQYDKKKTWMTINITHNVHDHEISYNLTNLTYANAVYDIRVFMKSAKAIGEDSWSKFSHITVKTAATLPARPPKTDIGSFEIAMNTKSRDVYIYWQTIETELQNGDNFTYQIIRVEENGKQLDREPSEKKETYAKFKDISFENFKFDIVSTNCVGQSKEKTTVYVPSYSEKPAEPVSFTKIAFDGGLYELSWNPMNDLNITSYTIFWCENERDRPYQCNGYLDWVQVPRNVSIYNTTVPDPRKIYQFAIAANTAHASSGMVWASCTAIHNKSVGKMKSVWINSMTSDKIQVGWKLECSDRIDIITGFIIYYCPIVGPRNVSCRDAMMNTTVKGDPHTMKGDVVGLKPYTTYKLQVAILTKNGQGHPSDSLYNTTYEAAPTPPRHVNVTEVTNTTITIEWEVPAAINGMLQYYTVHYNENHTKVENRTKLQIKDLQPYTNYNITVSAWTGKEGNRSQPIYQRTHIGVPGQPHLSRVRLINSTQVDISWTPPRDTGGRLDYYEIITADNYIHTNITSCDTECEEHLAITDCSEFPTFRVRAINLGNNMERYEGPWSKPGEANCFSRDAGPSPLTWVIIWVIGCFSGVAFLLFLGYSSKRIWIKCKKMQDVEVKLPPGLQPNMKLLGKGNEPHTQQLSADSSGCSSGQESVTSSLTSDSHASTDSGAGSSAKLAESPPTWESASSLRQRYVSASTKPDSSGDRGSWQPYVMVAKTADTPVEDSVSLDRSTLSLVEESAATTATGLYPPLTQHAWSSTGYISTRSSEEDLSNNPSPLPGSKSNVPGVYSVVGLPPSPMPRVRTGAEARGMERSNPRTADLIPLEPEARKEPAAVKPYVSLASLGQKTKNADVIAQVPSLADFVDMEFVHQINEQQQQQTLQSPPYSILEEISKPYVQTGLIDATNISRPPIEYDPLNSQRARYAASTTAESISGRPSVAPSFADPSVSLSHSLIELPSNVYVPVNSTRGMPSALINKESVQVQNPYVAVSTLESPSETSSLSSQPIPGANDHPTSSYRRSPQLMEALKTKTQKLADCDEPDTLSVPRVPVSLPVVKQASGYVTIVENQTHSSEKSALEGSSMSYVPHQQVNKKLSPPGYQQDAPQADEQYSKVTVVPTTT